MNVSTAAGLVAAVAEFGVVLPVSLAASATGRKRQAIYQLQARGRLTRLVVFGQVMVGLAEIAREMGGGVDNL